MSNEQKLDITEHTTAIDKGFATAVDLIEGMMHNDPKHAMDQAEKLGDLVDLWRMNIDQLYSDIDDAGANIGAWDDDD